MKLTKRAYRKSRFIYSYLKSLVFGNARKMRYSRVESFILFIGYPRSGHTLVASLLDAHPEIVLSMEWGALSHLRMGYNRNQMFYSIERNSRLFTKKLENTWTGYNYKVHGLWQGKYKNIKSIGDKLAGHTSLILKVNPELLEKLQHEVGCPVKIIHVIRNPFDTITTMAKRSYEKSHENGEFDADYLALFIDKFFMRAKEVRRLKDLEKFRILDLHHEELINDSSSVLSGLLEFLEVEIPENYITKCSEAIYKEPHKSRSEFKWPDNLKRKVLENLRQYEFLKHYSFEN